MTSRTQPYRITRLGALMAVATLTASASAQVDDFQSGERQGWGVDAQVENSSLSIETDGGPNGAGDRYLLYTSVGGGGPISRMLVPNTDGNQWTGAFDIEGLQFDVLNPGAAPLDLRLAVGNATTWYVSSDATTVAPGADWSTLGFPVNDGTMTAVGFGSDSLAMVLEDVTRLRLLSSVGLPTVSFGGTGSPQGDAIAASIGLDNIQAIIPEPASLLMACLAAIGAATRRRG